MPRISEMVPSNFLKKEDVEKGALVTIENVAQHNVAMANQPAELKYCLEFVEPLKPMVLNVTNMSILQEITDSDNSDDWLGLTIVLYNDPNVMYAGKRTGGIRLRAPRQDPLPAPAAQQVPPDAMDHMQQDPPVADEEIPF